MTTRDFGKFFSQYKSNIPTVRGEENKLAHYTTEKLLFMASQVDSKKYNITFGTFPVDNCVKVASTYCVYQFGPFYITITSNGNVYIENPRPTRAESLKGASLAKYTMSKYSDRTVTYNEDYIVSDTGHIIFRDAHDEFYNLQYDGRPIDAMNYALRVLGVI